MWKLSLKFYQAWTKIATEMKYLRARRAGARRLTLPACAIRQARRACRCPPRPPSPDLLCAALALPMPEGKGGSEMSTTTAALCDMHHGNLLPRTRAVGKHIVPIVADEARTFGMADRCFAADGHLRAHTASATSPEDKDSSCCIYRERPRTGRLLEEGITEAGALSSWARQRPPAYSVQPWRADAALLHLLLHLRLPARRPT